MNRYNKQKDDDSSSSGNRKYRRNYKMSMLKN